MSVGSCVTVTTPKLSRSASSHVNSRMEVPVTVVTFTMVPYMPLPLSSGAWSLTLLTVTVTLAVADSMSDPLKLPPSSTMTVNSNLLIVSKSIGAVTRISPLSGST